ncbi:MAG: ABC transporter permease [Acidobacteriota bacterium]|nr:ABC transporter permease [Acidobacteriota bacterium]
MTPIAQTLSRSNRLADRGARLLLLLLRARAVLVLVVLLAVFALLVPSFLSANNLSILSKHVSISAIVAIGMTFVVLAGGIDLSVGSMAGLSGMVAGYVLTHHAGGDATLLAVLAALLACLAVGAVNGLLVTRAGVAPFIATLGTLYIARGAALLISNGKTFPNLGGDASGTTRLFPAIGQSFLLHLPTPVWVMAMLFAIASGVATRTPLGRHIYAIGGNERAARLAGINVAQVKLVTYLFSGLCGALVGLIIAAQLEASHPATGETFELNAIAAVVLGGTSLMGGRGTVLGSLLGAFVIGVLADGLVMLGVSEFWQIVIKGLVIVLAVSIDQLQTRLQAAFLPYLMRSSTEAGR